MTSRVSNRKSEPSSPGVFQSRLDLVMIVVAGIEVFIYGGITFGWPNLVLMLKEEDYFRDRCGGDAVLMPSSIHHNNNTNYNQSRNLPMENVQGTECTYQDNRFGFVYQLISVITGTLNFLIGTFVDKVPFLCTRIVFIAMFVAGTLCVAYSTPDTAVLLMPGMLLIRVAGFLLYYSNMRLANFAPKIKGTIITIFAGLFDSSSSVFYLFLVMKHAGVSSSSIFIVYSATLSVPFLITMTLMPVHKIGSRTHITRLASYCYNRNYRPEEQTPHHTDEVDDRIIKDEDGEEDVQNAGRNNGRCDVLKKCLLKYHLEFLFDATFYFLLIYLMVLTLRKEFFVISYDSYLAHKARKDQSIINHYSAVFGISQFLGIFVTPVGGIVIDYSRSKDNRTAYVLQFSFTLLCGILLTICSFIPPIEMLYAANILYVVCRGLTYSVAAAFVSDSFKPEMFGSILGWLETFGYLLALLQYPLLAMSNQLLHHDYTGANVIILLLCIFALIHPVRLAFKCNAKRRCKAEKLEDVEAENELQETNEMKRF